MYIPITAIIIFAILFSVSLYLSVGYIMDFIRFKEPNTLRKNIIHDINLDRRTHNLYNYIAWHIEDCSQAQDIKQGELAALCGYMTANAIEGFNRQQATEQLKQINEMARTLQKQHGSAKDAQAANVPAVSVAPDTKDAETH